MKRLLKLEEAFQFAVTVYLFYQLPMNGWLYWVFFFIPDLSMLGYAVNATVGSFSYNLVHHKGVAIALYLAGLYVGQTELVFAGLVLYGHSSFDRLCGYGLKYPDSFKNTHLGLIGK